jgi:glycosyltransferase involved in cell wall biosynthesis
VLSQTFTDFQVVVYDNASGDETREIVEAISKKDSRVFYHCHPQNIGPTENFNFGMSQVETPYFSLLADDNYLLPNFFEEAMSHLNNCSEKTIFVGQVESVDEKGWVISRSLENWPSGLVQAPDGIIHSVECGFPTWEGILFRRQIIADYGTLDSSFGGSDDQEFVGRIARDYDFCVSKKVCARFTVHDDSWTSNRALSEFIDTGNRLLERWLVAFSWTADQRRRLRTALRRKIELTLRRCVITNSIIGDDMDTLDTANQYVANTKDLSKRTIKLVKMANFANANPIIKWTVSLAAKLHLVKYRLKAISR